MKKLRCVFFILFSLFLSKNSFCQDFSNKGKDFWLVYPAHIDGNTSRMALYISSTVSTSGTVFLGGSSISFSVTANQATVIPISPAVYPVLNAQNEGIATGKGIHIVAQAPIVVYAHVLNAARSGSTLVLPTNTLGREYTTIGYASMANANSPSNVQNGSPAGSQFEIVAVEDSTTVEITPSTNDISNSRPAGLPFTIKLNKGDVYQFRTVYNRDVTGSRIRSLAVANQPCKPVAVFSGSSWTSMGCSGAGSGDNLFLQLMPKTAWGKNYITAPFADKAFDIFRILVSDPSTIVTLNGTALPSSQLINGTYYEFSSSAANTISADKPINVVQYIITQNCDGKSGDPEMIILNSIEQTLNDVTVVSARQDLTPPSTNITRHYFTIIMKTNATSSLRIDGNVPTGSFVAIGSSGYSYLQENVTATTALNPSHRINADSGFIALAYGLGNVESYGYNAGTNIKDLYQFVSIKNQLGTVDFPASCVNTPFYFSMTFPYQPTEIKWVFGGLFPDVTINDPVYDSTWMVNDRQLYRYRLNTTNSVGSVGTYPIKVLAKNPTPDGCGNEQEITFDLQIYERPKADFDFTTKGCVTEAVSFSNKSKSNGRAVTKWVWNFGDGGSDDKKDPQHIFSAAGSFNTLLSLVNDVGCVSDTLEKTIRLSKEPVAAFTTTGPFCDEKSISFKDQSTAETNFPIVKWTWIFGDQSTPLVSDNNSTQQHSYPTGDYKASLQVETSTGCIGPVYESLVSIHPFPAPEFTMPESCLSDPYSQFVSTTTIADGSEANLSYNWNFGDPNAVPSNPNTSTLAAPKHKYTATGTYPVFMEVTSKDGCVASVQKDFTVNGAVPKSAFSISGGNTHCSDSTFVLINNSTVDVGSIVKLEIFWDENDLSNKTIDDTPSPGETYQIVYPSFFTPATKNYKIRVRAYSGETCFNDYAETIQVNAIPQIVFDPLIPVCANTSSFNLNASVTNIPGAGLFIGTGVTNGNVFNPAIAKNGNHLLRYVFTGSNGCIGFAEQNILVYPTPVIQLTPGKTLLEGGSILLDPAISAVSPSYEWLPNIALNNNTIAQPTASPVDDVTYTIKVTSGDGCIDSASTQITVLKLPKVPNVFTPNNDGINDTWQIPYLDSYVGATVELYNRYGQLVYQIKNYSKPWDGTANGKPVPVGTYYYLINPKNGRKQLSGFVDVLR